SHMTALPPPSTSSSAIMRQTPLHPSLTEAPPSPQSHHPATSSLPQPLHNHTTASLASLAQHLKREIEGLALPQLSPSHRGMDEEGEALKSRVWRRLEGGGVLMVDDPGFHEVIFE
ncbi:MAG: hypothetical protein GY696_36400, partial [Gammaproteobacteria bacterium]|nr:hypothetical protein [Gammaproteobacteria bacterium]